MVKKLNQRIYLKRGEHQSEAKESNLLICYKAIGYPPPYWYALISRVELGPKTYILYLRNGGKRARSLMEDSQKLRQVNSASTRKDCRKSE